MSLPSFLVPELTVHANGSSEALDLGSYSGGLLLTLGISEVIEQESLLVSVHGSADGSEWNSAPLIEFPQKFYTGVSAVFLDTAGHSFRYLQANWKVDRWGRGVKTPSFRFYLFVEPIAG